MRFKAKLAPEQVSLLHSLIVPMTRLGTGGEGCGNGAFTRNGTILSLTSDLVQLSCKGKSQETDGMACFAELCAKGYSSIFLDHRIESAAPNNAIVMELDLLQLRMALKSVIGDTNLKNGFINDTSILAGAALEAVGTLVEELKLAQQPAIDDATVRNLQATTLATKEKLWCVFDLRWEERRRGAGGMRRKRVGG